MLVFMQAMSMVLGSIHCHSLSRYDLTEKHSAIELQQGAQIDNGVITVKTSRDSAYTEFIHTTEALPLEGGARYKVSLQYTYDALEPGGHPYMLFRPRGRGASHDTPFHRLEPVAKGVAEYTAEIPLQDDYYLLIGVFRGALMTVKNLVIEQLHGGERKITPDEDLSILDNPDKGWVLHFYDNAVPSYGQRVKPGEPVVFPGLGMAYFRLAWAYLEPKEGVYDWSLIDPWYEQFVAQGLRIGFRITCFESHDLAYATPEWVKDAGARFYPLDDIYSEGREAWHPGWDDPVFLEKLDAFLAVFAARYDGDPNVAWIDVGSLGVWGEGHIGWSTAGAQSLEVYQKHIDLHCKHFQNTLLVANDDFGNQAVRYAVGRGLTLRDDSLCVYKGRPYMSDYMADWFWRDRPVILETGHYTQSVLEGAWDTDAIVRAVEKYRATWLSIHAFYDDLLEKEFDLIKRVTNRLGYWLFVREATIPRALIPGESFLVTVQWENRGVAPLYRNRAVSFALRDKNNNIVWSAADDRYDLRRLMPETDWKTFHSHTLPDTIAPGVYTLCLGLSQTKEPVIPDIALAMQGRSEDRWHALAEVNVREKKR